MFYILMNIIINILNIIVLFKTFSFGLYEIKTNNNKFGGIASIVVEVFVFVLILYLLWVR